ncbi:MAG: universal stress protein, partial [Halapricum sp.]
AAAFDADLDVVHITDIDTEATEEVVANARDALEANGFDVEPEVLHYDDVDRLGSSTAIGHHLLDLIDERGYDHVVMGTHGGGAIESVILGSASETVLDGADIPVTVVH